MDWKDEIISHLVQSAVTYLPTSVLTALMSRKKRNNVLKWTGVFIVAFTIVYQYAKKKKQQQMKHRQRIADRVNDYWKYNQVKELVQNAKLPLPAMLVDLDAFESNIRSIVALAQYHGKVIRIATKSIRVPWLIKHAMDLSKGVFKGLMCFSVDEASFLANLTFSDENDNDRNDKLSISAGGSSSHGANSKWNHDILVAYPVVQQHEIETAFQLALQNKAITLMVDSIQHVDIISQVVVRQKRLIAEQLKKDEYAINPDTIKIRLCIDVDMSLRPFAGLVHIGVYRSSCRTLLEFANLARYILESEHVTLVGVMGYEAQIAGLPDEDPFDWWILNMAKKLVKRISTRNVASKRNEISNFIQSTGINIEFFNGGGSGNIHSCITEKALTEVTVGSGLMQSKIFDYYKGSTNLPALAYALPITRIPEKGVVTCQSGGFIASGSCHENKSPVPFLPTGLQSISSEGFGEVQTPLRSQENLQIGDPILVRPAKAGEVAEHFVHYTLKRGQTAVKKVKTYRGFHQIFH